MLGAGLESPYGEWLENWEDREERNVTTHVPCSDYFEVRDQALLAHATQVDPDGPWFTCPRDLQAEVWPTEDFELARSVVADHVARGRPVRRHPRAGAPRQGGGPWSAGAARGRGPGREPGVLGFLVVAPLGVATVPAHPFDEPPDPPDRPPDDEDD